MSLKISKSYLLGANFSGEGKNLQWRKLLELQILLKKKWDKRRQSNSRKSLNRIMKKTKEAPLDYKYTKLLQNTAYQNRRPIKFFGDKTTYLWSTLFGSTRS